MRSTSIETHKKPTRYHVNLHDVIESMQTQGDQQISAALQAARGDDSRHISCKLEWGGVNSGRSICNTFYSKPRDLHVSEWLICGMRRCSGTKKFVSARKPPGSVAADVTLFAIRKAPDLVNVCRFHAVGV